VSHLRRSRRSRETVNNVWLKFTGLSGEPTVDCANGQPCNPRVTRGRANGWMGAPDCPATCNLDCYNACCLFLVSFCFHVLSSQCYFAVDNNKFISALCSIQEDRPAGGQGGPRPSPGAAATAPAPAPVAARP
jgi:hypothetical protein